MITGINRIPEDIQAKHPHAVAIFEFPDFPSPQWFNAPSKFFDAKVDEQGRVYVNMSFLELVAGAVPAVGTALVLHWQGSLVFAEPRASFDERLEQEKSATKARADAWNEARNREQAARQNEMQAYAEEVNAKLNIPVRWTSGHKTVLSGLSANSSGTGENARTVAHVLLLEPINEGRLKRESNSFLCTSASGSNGEDWTDSRHTHSWGVNGKYVSRITCAQCVKLASQWTNPGARVPPDLIED